MNRALGIDYGDARVGVAVSDELGMLAHPLETVPHRASQPLSQDSPAIQRIVTLLTEKKADTIVLGLPKNMNGTTGESAEKVRKFADALREALQGKAVTIRFVDERLTTVAAHRMLQDAGKTAKQSKALVDQVAAQQILQCWLDSQALLSPPPLD
jgi:putative Holliday junction resolvase